MVRMRVMSRMAGGISVGPPADRSILASPPIMFTVR